MHPKYKLGDKVWVIYDKKATEKEVTGIRLGLTYKKVPVIYYGLNVPQEKFATVYIQEEEADIFYSKEELLKSL